MLPRAHRSLHRRHLAVHAGHFGCFLLQQHILQGLPGKLQSLGRVCSSSRFACARSCSILEAVIVAGHSSVSGCPMLRWALHPSVTRNSNTILFDEEETGRQTLIRCLSIFLIVDRKVTTRRSTRHTHGRLPSSASHRAGKVLRVPLFATAHMLSRVSVRHSAPETACLS